MGSLQHVKLNSYKIRTTLKQHWKSVFEVAMAAMQIAGTNETNKTAIK